MDMRSGLLLTILLLTVYGQDHAPAFQRVAQYEPVGYWVFFTDKNGVTFDPHQYFDPRTIDRRQSMGLEIYDTLDFPVREDYVDALRGYTDTVIYVSRWFNAAFIGQGCRKTLNNLDFVRAVGAPSVSMVPAQLPFGLEASVPDKALLATQTAHLGGDLLMQEGLDGSGVRIAVFDTGFPQVESHPAFSHLWEDNRIVATWDFHRNREDVFAHNAHGTMVLSVLAGYADGIPMGLATGAEYLLARTEIDREIMAEEHYWLAAMEWADRHGADIINSSLGYIHHRYFPEQMDGQTTLVARAAGIAAKKGMLVVNAAGNEGSNVHWRIIGSPADADSVLAVGGIDPLNFLPAEFSSRGPTADGRMKPNVSAFGQVVAAKGNGYTTVSGTSFAAPLVAGLAACLWQHFSDWTNMELFDAIERSAHLHPFFDYAHGYGIPHAALFFCHRASFLDHPTFDIKIEHDTILLSLRLRPGEVKNDCSGTFRFDDYLYYHIMDADGRLLSYHVVVPEDSPTVSAGILLPGQSVMASYRGYVTSARHE